MKRYFIKISRAVCSKNKLQEAMYDLAKQYKHNITNDIDAFIENIKHKHQETVAKYPRCKAEVLTISQNNYDDSIYITFGENTGIVAYLVKGEC